MSFKYGQYLMVLIPVLILFLYLFRRDDKSFYQWVEDHWFLRQTWSSKVSRILFFLSMATLLISTLDLRGPEEKIETSIPDQKTIILIDKSASMLVEDVRPNRFKKAVMMARHFVKKAAGHQVSIIVFSDTHKRVVPFTDDIDLLDSILGGLLSLDINVGGSELSVAMKEATGYFSLDDDYKGGNLLVFTDGEEHDSLENFKLQEDVNLAIVGVGTLNGGPIPLRRRGGSFKGYKKYNGQEINSRLNEVNIKKFVNRTQNSKYWISLSYSLPTDEILDFFRVKFQSKLSKGESRVRPVLAKYLVIPAVVLYLLSYLISLKRSYVAMSLLVLFLGVGIGHTAHAQDEKPPSPQDVKAQLLLEKMRSGDLDETSKLKIAEELLKLNKVKESSIIYEETVGNVSNFPKETLLNMGTSLLKSGDIGKALNFFDKVRESKDLSENDEKVIETNTIRAIQKKKSDQQKKQEKEKEKKKNKDKNKDKKQKESDGNDKNDKKGKGSQSQSPKDKKPSDKKNNEDNKKKEKKDNNEEKDKKKNNDEKDQDKKRNQKKRTVKQKENDIKKKRKMVKIPATLKQLMNDDRGLQKKFLKTTIGKDKKSERRDW
mgnify:CR=1 FL=1